MKRAFLLVAQLAALWPSVSWVALKTRYASDERHSLLAFLVAALFLARSRRPQPLDERSLAGPAAGVLGCALASTFAPPLVAAVLAAASLTWTASVLWTPRRFHVGVFGLGLLGLPVLPLFELHLGYPLRFLATEGAALLLRLGGLNVVAVGTCLDGAGALVGVDPPCAGLWMLWTALLVVGTAATFWDRGARATLLGALAAVALVVAANSLRAASLFYVETGRVSAPAWTHGAVGLVLQLGVLSLILAYLLRAPRVRCVTRACT